MGEPPAAAAAKPGLHGGQRGDRVVATKVLRAFELVALCVVTAKAQAIDDAPTGDRRDPELALEQCL